MTVPAPPASGTSLFRVDALTQVSLLVLTASLGGVILAAQDPPLGFTPPFGCHFSASPDIAPAVRAPAATFKPSTLVKAIFFAGSAPPNLPPSSLAT